MASGEVSPNTFKFLLFSVVCVYLQSSIFLHLYIQIHLAGGLPRGASSGPPTRRWDRGHGDWSVCLDKETIMRPSKILLICSTLECWSDPNIPGGQLGDGAWLSWAGQADWEGKGNSKLHWQLTGETSTCDKINCSWHLQIYYLLAFSLEIWNRHRQ